jgi:integrase
VTLEAPARKNTLPAAPTLADLRDFVATYPDLAPQLRNNVTSAISTFAKAIGVDPQVTPAQQAYWDAKLSRFVPAKANLTEGRWRDICSLLRKAFTLAGLQKVPKRSNVPMSPAWDALFRQLPTKQARYGFTRAARYFSTRDIAPAHVNDAAMDQFNKDLAASWLMCDPLSTCRLACKIWNDAATTIPGWPSQTLTVLPFTKGTTYRLPDEAFLPSLMADVDGYLKRLEGADLLADIDFKPLRPASIKTRTNQLRAAISAFVREGGNPLEMRTLADLVAIDAVHRVMRFLMSRNDGKKNRQMFHICELLTAIAKHWVHVNDAHLAQLKRLCKRLASPAGMTTKNRNRLDQFDEQQNIQAIMQLPRVLRAEALKSKKSLRIRALLMQTAVAIELLVMNPLRLHNLHGLHNGRQIKRTSGGIWQINVPREEVKNSLAIKGALPRETSHLLDEYVSKYLPALAATGNTALFPGRGDKPKTAGLLGMQISKAILRKTGIEMNPHLFRHFGALHYLNDHVGDYGTMRLALGHKNLETLTLFYSGTETPAALEHFDKHVLKSRGAMALSTKRPATRLPKGSAPETYGD